MPPSLRSSVLRRTTLLLVPLASVACGSDGDPPGPVAPEEVDVVGSYALASVNGDPVPWVAGVTDRETLHLNGGTLELAPTDSFRLVLEWKVDGDRFERREEEVRTGRYVHLGEVIWFPESGELQLSGKLEGTSRIRLLGRFFEDWREEFFTDEWARLRFR